MRSRITSRTWKYFSASKIISCAIWIFDAVFLGIKPRDKRQDYVAATQQCRNELMTKDKATTRMIFMGWNAIYVLTCLSERVSSIITDTHSIRENTKRIFAQILLPSNRSHPMQATIETVTCYRLSTSASQIPLILFIRQSTNHQYNHGSVLNCGLERQLWKKI